MHNLTLALTEMHFFISILNVILSTTVMYYFWKET